MKRRIFYAALSAALSVVLFVYVICGGLTVEWLRRNNNKGLDCIIEEMHSSYRSRSEIKACMEWDRGRMEVPWYAKIYKKAIFERDEQRAESQ